MTLARGRISLEENLKQFRIDNVFYIPTAFMDAVLVDGTITEPKSFIGIREITSRDGVDFVIGINRLSNKGVSTCALKYLVTII